MAVIDASVAVRWFVYGPGSDRAAPWQERDDLIAPDLICAEVGNAVWLYLRHRQLTVDEGSAILDSLPACFRELVPSSALAVAALAIAKAEDHPIYDCFYVALARREAAPLVTADRKLAALAERAGVAVEVIA